MVCKRLIEEEYGNVLQSHQHEIDQFNAKFGSWKHSAVVNWFKQHSSRSTTYQIDETAGSTSLSQRNEPLHQNGKGE